MTKLRVEAQAAEEEEVFDAYKLEHLYELMYKYGWYNLYDKASAKFIEPNLKELLNEGLDHLIGTFEWWLKEHVLPGWWDVRFGEESGDEENAYINLMQEFIWREILTRSDFLDWIFNHVNREKTIYDEFSNDMSYFEPYALQFLQEKFPDNEEIQENMNESDAISYIDTEALHEDFKNYLVNETSVFSPEEMEDVYGGYLPSMAMEDPFFYGIVKENEDEFIQWTYQKFIDHFGFESIIEDLQDAVTYMESVDRNSIEDMIAAFNKGLTAEHYSGKMSEHFSNYLDELGSNISTRLLDALSEGEYNKKWNYELKKEGIPVDANLRRVSIFSLLARAPKVLEVLKETEKYGYIIRDEMWDSEGLMDEPMRITTCYTPTGDWIGDEKTAKYLVEEKGIAPELSDKNHCVCSIGFCEKENKWAGWSHRALAMFGIGDKLFEEEFGDDKTPFIEHGSKEITNMDEARQAAVNFARSVS